MYVGRYEPIDGRAHLKLWLARYTFPALLSTADVAYAVSRSDFCAGQKPPDREFYTEKFAVARKTSSGYEVERFAQLRKVDFCKGDNVEGVFVLSKEPATRGATTINWTAQLSIGGLAATEPSRTPNSLPYQFNSSGVPTALVRDLDAQYLLSYSKDLEQRGVGISVSATAWLFPSTGVAAIATAAHAPISAPMFSNPVVPPASAAEPARAPDANRRYCLVASGAPAGSSANCADHLGELAHMIAGMPVSAAISQDTRNDGFSSLGGNPRAGRQQQFILQMK